MSGETGTHSGTATPLAAREHARAQAGAHVLAMQTLPARNAKSLPEGVAPSAVVWDETLGAGDYAAHVLRRGARLRLTDIEGDACVALLVYNAAHPIERLNVMDTMKVQWNAYLKRGALLLSDMGRVMMSILADTCGKHDALCGCSNAAINARRYGSGENYSPHPNARDRFLLALAKHGLGRKDVTANVNLFKGVRVEADGSTTFLEKSSEPGDHVVLRAEMDVLVALVNAPHVLDGRTTYTVGPVRALAWSGPVTPEDDPIRNATPEAVRAFENVEDLYAGEGR